jgi:hypothetical protein
VIQETLKHSQHLTSNKEITPEVINELKEIYNNTKNLLLQVSDQYVLTNLDNLSLLVTFDHFEVEVVDYRNHLQNDTKQRSSSFQIDECAEKIRSHLGTSKDDLLPIRKLDIKTDLIELNPYINNTKLNVTGLISSRSLGIDAYSTLSKSKLDIDSICGNTTMNVDFQTNEFLMNLTL